MKKDIVAYTIQYYMGPWMVGLPAYLMIVWLLWELGYPWGSLIVILGIALVFTTRYRMEINLKERTYLDHLWILGYKKGTPRRFDSIDFIFILSGFMNTYQHAAVTGMSRGKTREFDGYIKFSDGKELYLMSSSSNESLIEKLRPISRDLNAPVFDYTKAEPVEVIPLPQHQFNSLRSE